MFSLHLESPPPLFLPIVAKKCQFSPSCINNTPGTSLLRKDHSSRKSLPLFVAAKLTTSLMWHFNVTDVWGWQHSGDTDHSFIHTLMVPICVWIISNHHSSVPSSAGAEGLPLPFTPTRDQPLSYSHWEIVSKVLLEIFPRIPLRLTQVATPPSQVGRMWGYGGGRIMHTHTSWDNLN